MPLRIRAEKLPETIQEFELAAEDKYLEGLELMTATCSGGGIYLMGYVAEMLLKTAYFMYTGARPKDMIAPRLGPAKIRGQNLIPGIRYESYHSIMFWSRLLIAVRRGRSDHMSPDVEAPFQQRTRRLYQNWWVGMRYRQDLSEAREMQSVLGDVTWLRDNHAVFWS